MAFPSLKMSYYKGNGGKYGAVQFHLQRPHWYCEERGCRVKDFDSPVPRTCSGNNQFPHPSREMKTREGCVFLDITSATGPNVYDWEKKVVIALSVQDMQTLLFALETDGECKLFHDPNMKGEGQGKITKGLNVSSPNGIRSGVLITATQKDATRTTPDGSPESVKHTVPLSGAEVRGLTVFLREALTQSLAW